MANLNELNASSMALEGNDSLVQDTNNTGDNAFELSNGVYFGDGKLKYIILVSYMATFIFGLTGNALVIYIIAHFSKVRNKSVANYYIWNLAFADILFMLAMPLFCYATYTRHWPFGDACCKIAYLLRDINKYASVFTLAALSLDRYVATCHRLAYLRTIQVGKIVCVVIWLACSIIATPYLLFARTYHTSDGRKTCRLVWPENYELEYLEFWTIFQLMCSLVVPFFFICLSYALLIKRFRKMVRMQDNNDVKSPGRKMTQTVVVVVVTFLVCQVPYHAVQLVSLAKTEKAAEYRARGAVYIPPQGELTRFIYMNALAQILVFISSCCNPYIYALMNESFRKLYSIVLCRCKRGHLQMEDLKDFEVDGQYVPISFKIQVTFHLPCQGQYRGYRKKLHKRNSFEMVNVQDNPPSSIG